MVGALAAAVLPAALPPIRARARTAPAPPFAGETFVGPADDGKTLVAIVVGEGSGERPARAYLCDAGSIDAWLEGAAAGGSLKAADASGVRLVADVGQDVVVGEATLPDATVLAFAAAPAAGIAGLYEVAVAADGTMRGAAATGGRLAGRIAAAATPAAEIATPVGEDGTFPFAGSVTITPPDGEPVELAGTISTPGAGAFRMIVLADGRSTGGGRRPGSGESATGTVKWKSKTR